MGYRGTGKHLCTGCKKKGIYKILTADNCSPSIFKKGSGSCRDCMRIWQNEWNAKNPEKCLKRSADYRKRHPDKCVAIVKKYCRTFAGRHVSLKSKISKENIPTIDLIWNLNFYTELIRDNECHYCLGPLNPTSHGLDCKDNGAGHTCWNVVPCCKSCNQKKMNDTTYEEMMLLAPVLREIRLRRESKTGDLNGNFNSQCIQPSE